MDEKEFYDFLIYSKCESDNGLEKKDNQLICRNCNMEHIIKINIPVLLKERT